MRRRCTILAVLVLLAIPAILVPTLLRERARETHARARAAELVAREAQIVVEVERRAIERLLDALDRLRDGMSALLDAKRTVVARAELMRFLWSQAQANNPNDGLEDLPPDELIMRALGLRDGLYSVDIMGWRKPETVPRWSDAADGVDATHHQVLLIEAALPVLAAWRERFGPR